MSYRAIEWIPNRIRKRYRELLTDEQRTRLALYPASRQLAIAGTDVPVTNSGRTASTVGRSTHGVTHEQIEH